MKTILCLIISLFCFSDVHSQLSPTLYFSNEGSFSSTYSKSGLKNSYFYENPGLYKTFGKKGNIGLFCEGVFEDETWSVAPGMMFAFQSKGTNALYNEIGIGAGFERTYTGSDYRVTYLNFYEWIENHPDRRAGMGKFLISANISYSKEWGLWRMAYAIFYPTKWVGFGVHTQSYGATGGRIQFVLPKGINLYVAGGVQNRFQIGSYVLLQNREQTKKPRYF